MARKIPEVLTATEQEAIVSQPNPRYLTGHRNRVMLRLMLDTGLRLSEAIHLRWQDIDLNSGKVMVRQGKGAKDRTLWTGEANLAALVEWLLGTGAKRQPPVRVAGVQVQREEQLLLVALALGVQRQLAGLGQRRRQQGQENGDNGDHHQQFDKREGRSWRLRPA